MKTLYTLIALLAINFTLFSQAPQRLSYQAVIRNSSGGLVISHAVGMKISILQGTSTGTAVYAETHTTTTNANGLATIEIGGGIVVSGTFTGINWGSGPYWIKTETDPEGGTSYTIKGTNPILSVPYALYSKSAENGFNLPYSGSGTTSGGTDLFYLKNLGTGRAMQVESGTNTAIWGKSAGGYAGIDGRNTTGYGIYGNSESGDGIHGRSTSGNGVYGQAAKYGVYGKSTGTQGRSVTGEAEGTASIAVQGIATNTSSTGVWGEGSNQGVYGTTSLATGKGVYGVASSATGENYGVYGKSASSDGYGVYGESNMGVCGIGEAIGLYGSASANANAYGVSGHALSETGTTVFAVFGRCFSSSGYSGYFVGGKFHISGNTGIGTSAPVYKLDVIGSIRATGSVFYGGTEGNTNGTAYTKPDFVFNESYNVLQTDDVETYLKRENHLPWITSAEKEKEENGEVTDMTRMAFETVESVENLQLQIIDQQKMIRELKAENKKMENRLERIERLLNSSRLKH
jgi:hypothetical protein